MDKVKLKFQDEAIDAIAHQALERKTGARALRAILEQVMLDIMYDVPSRPEIEEVVITKEVINKSGDPIVVYKKDTKDKAS